MKRWIARVLLALLAAGPLASAQAQPRPEAQPRLYSQAELEGLLAPVALYPDPVLSHILIAATFPDDVREAAAWSRANPQLSGENAVRAVEAMPWHPSVKALAAFPELVLRMDESPQWVADLGFAFQEQEPHVMDAVQALRRRAQASGNLQSNAQQQVYEQGGALAVYPAQPQVVYVPWYDPYVVYGPVPWYYRPVYWRPWYARPTPFVVTSVFFVRSVDWPRRHVVFHRRAFHQGPPVTSFNYARPARPIVDSVRLPAQQPRPSHVAPRAQVAPRMQVAPRTQVQAVPSVRPIVDSVRMPVHQSVPRSQAQPHPQHRAAPRQANHGHARR